MSLLCKLIRHDWVAVGHAGFRELEICSRCGTIRALEDYLRFRSCNTRRIGYLAGRVGREAEQKFSLFMEYQTKLQKHGFMVINPLALTQPIWAEFGHSVEACYASLTLPLLLAATEMWVIPSPDLMHSEGVHKEFELASQLNIDVLLIIDPEQPKFSFPLESWEDLLKANQEVVRSWSGKSP